MVLKIVSESKIDLGNCVSKVVPALQILWIVASVLETCFGKHSLEREGFLQSLSRLQTFSENSVYD